MYVQMEATSEMSWEFSSKHPPKSGQGESVRPRQTGKAPSKYTCSYSPEPDVERRSLNESRYGRLIRFLSDAVLFYGSLP